MGMDTTITEQDLDAASSQLVQGLRRDNNDHEPDLTVDGLSESVLARLIRVLTFRKS